MSIKAMRCIVVHRGTRKVPARIATTVSAYARLVSIVPTLSCVMRMTGHALDDKHAVPLEWMTVVFMLCNTTLSATTYAQFLKCGFYPGKWLFALLSIVLTIASNDAPSAIVTQTACCLLMIAEEGTFRPQSSHEWRIPVTFKQLFVFARALLQASLLLEDTTKKMRWALSVPSVIDALWIARQTPTLQLLADPVYLLGTSVALWFVR